MPEIDVNWKKIKNIDLIACGTSFYASQVATYWFEKYLGITSSAFSHQNIATKVQPNPVSVFLSLSLNPVKLQIRLQP